MISGQLYCGKGKSRFYKFCVSVFAPGISLKWIGIWMLFSCSAIKSNAQINGYTFSSTTGNALVTGTFTNLLGTDLDDDVSALTNIGFTFNYGGTNYTTFSATSNGLFKLGAQAVTDYNNAIVNLAGPYLMPYWDDNYTDIDGNVQYKLTGVAGSRKLIVDFNLSYLGVTGTADKHFQVWLFETSNQIKFVYGSGNNSNGGFSAGILTNGNTDFYSVNTTTNTGGGVTRIDNNSIWPGTGRTYVFNSGAALPVSILNFSGFRDANKNQLHWSTATESNNTGFELQRSEDGLRFVKIGFVPSLSLNGNSITVLKYEFTDYTATGARQYYRFRQIDKDGNSTLSNIIKIEGNQATTITVQGLYPNPANGVVSLKITSPVKTRMMVSLNDLSGKELLVKIITVEVGNNAVPIEIGRFSKGEYLLHVSSSDNRVDKSLKLIISR